MNKYFVVVLAAALSLLVVSCSSSSSPQSQADDSSAAAGETESAPQQDSASEASSTSANGFGKVDMGSMTFNFEGDVCFTSPGFVQVTGLSSDDADLGPAWISISGSTSEDYDEDGVGDITADVTIEYGKTETFGSAPDGLPDLYANVTTFSSRPSDEVPSLEFTITGGLIFGSGQMSDTAGVLIPAGETQAFSFDATCTS